MEIDAAEISSSFSDGGCNSGPHPSFDITESDDVRYLVSTTSTGLDRPGATLRPPNSLYFPNPAHGPYPSPWVFHGLQAEIKKQQNRIPSRRMRSLFKNVNAYW